MKVYRIDDLNGFYSDVLTANELQECGNLLNILTEDEFWELPYTIKQLHKARELHNDREWCLDYEEEYGIQPDVYDILKHLWEVCYEQSN